MNLVKICNKLVQKVKNYAFQTLTGPSNGWSDLILANARGQSILEKGQKRAEGQNKNFGARKCYLGPNF